MIKTGRPPYPFAKDLLVSNAKKPPWGVIKKRYKNRHDSF